MAVQCGALFGTHDIEALTNMRTSILSAHTVHLKGNLSFKLIKPGLREGLAWSEPSQKLLHL